MDAHELEFIPLFQGLDEREFASLASVLSEKTLEPGQVLFNVGDKAWACYIVVSGTIDVELPSEQPGGDVHHLATLGVGELLGEVCLIDGGRRSARCVAGPAGARLAQLSRPEFDQIFNAGNRLAYRLMDLVSVQLVHRIANTTRQLQNSVSDG